METMDIQSATKMYSYDELNAVNNDLSNIYSELQKQTKVMEKPDSIVQRVFVDLFGIIALYLLMFFGCDITRSILTGEDLFGIKWLFFGPYYFFTGAPLMTRIWKSKKFLEDLSELKINGLEYPEDKSCTQEGQVYTNDCTSHEQHPFRHPLRQKLGTKLDWLLRHTVGKRLGGLLGNATCQDQGTTIARDCSESRIQAIFDCYNFFCDQNNVQHRATDINWPNTVANGAAVFNGWDHIDLSAYQIYYNAYIAIYNIGRTWAGGHGEPEDLNTEPDTGNYYSYNAAVLFNVWPASLPYPGTIFPIPPWFYTEAYTPYLNHQMSDQDFIVYFQQHYKEHLLDYWDEV